MSEQQERPDDAQRLREAADILGTTPRYPARLRRIADELDAAADRERALEGQLDNERIYTAEYKGRAQIEIQMREAVEAENRALVEAIKQALNELGVPDDPDYPAPVGNAVDLLQEAIGAKLKLEVVPYSEARDEYRRERDEAKAENRALVEALREIKDRLRSFPSHYPGYTMIQRIADRAAAALSSTGALTAALPIKTCEHGCAFGSCPHGCTEGAGD